MAMADREPARSRLSERHAQQRTKNWIVLLVIIGLCVLFFAITIVRFGGAGILPGAPK
jgi:hypothetical protein